MTPLAALLILTAAATLALTVREARRTRNDLARFNVRLADISRKATAADDEAHARRVIDQIGYHAGAAPSITAHLGEHIIVRGSVTAASHNGTTHVAAVSLDWPAARWYGDDALDTHRSTDGFADQAPTVNLPFRTRPRPGEPVALAWRVTHTDTGVRLDLVLDDLNL